MSTRAEEVISGGSPNAIATHPASKSGAVVRRLADVVPKPIDWLWKERIARGKVTLIAGHPGLGKSQLTSSLAACVSLGGVWPVDQTPCPKGNVIILNAEDDVADTIRPRLEAVGADLDCIHVIDAIRVPSLKGVLTERGLDLSADIGEIGRVSREIGDVSLIVVDPLSAYIGGIDSHRDTEVRGVFAPLGRLAAELNAAVVLVSHLNKSSGNNAITRVNGSIGILAAARAAFFVVKDPNDSGRRLFLNAKNNIGRDHGNGLSFRVEPVTLDSGIATSKLSWDSEVVEVTLDEVMDKTDGGQVGDSRLSGCINWLKTTLADGPTLASEVTNRAKAEGFAYATLRRASENLDVVREKDGYQGAWYWRLAESVVNGPKDAQS